MSKEKEFIESGRAVLGLELGSTRIKAVLIDENHAPIASGSHEWENRLENGFWTYSLEEVWTGLRHSYQDLAADVEKKYGAVITKIGAIGFSAMMHGYMVFDREDKLLVPFRTWRNSSTGQAADALTGLFAYNIPQRWSISHLYQAILNGEGHVPDVAYMTTLAGYIHWQLTGNKVLGVGDASGMFPIDVNTKDYDAEMMEKFDRLAADKHYSWKLRNIMPRVLVAGERAGALTEEGARLLDASGRLQAGSPVCPPEGDAGTGMVATNSVAKRSGNVSAGTSVFGMVVLERELSRVYTEINLVTTPDGSLVGMAHANNCTSDLNAWVGIFREFAESFGINVDMDKLFETLYNKALEGDADCGGLLSYGYLSGEPVMGVMDGRALFARAAKSRFNLANFMRTHLFAALGALKAGMDIMLKEEQVEVDHVLGHGGLFKTEGVAQSILAAAIDAPVSVMETAGEGGPWGMAILAAYMMRRDEGESLQDYLAEKVFGGKKGTVINPNPDDVRGFEVFMERFKKGIAIEEAAIKNLL